MSLYNMIAGMNAGLAVLASPFLPRRADHFPRFRDIFREAEQADPAWGGRVRETPDDYDSQSLQMRKLFHGLDDGGRRVALDLLKSLTKASKGG